MHEPNARFDLLRYANVWEDAEILIEALEPKSKRILSICSSGDQVLSLVAAGAQTVVAADLSPVQLEALKLRIAAIEALEYQECLCFLGIQGNAHKRRELWILVQKHLDQESLAFWQGHLVLIEQGICNPGKFERYLDLFGQKILPILQPQSRIQALLRADSPQKREAIWQKWNHWAWKLFFRAFFSKTMLGLGRDPSFLRHVHKSPGQMLASRLRHCLLHIPLSDNPYLSRILTGNWQSILPHYLRPEHFQTLKSQARSKIEFFCGPIHKACTLGPFDAFNYSDLLEYLDLESSQAVLSALVAHANPGARLALWNMMVERNPAVLNSALERLDVSDDLHARDRACFYMRFHLCQLRSMQ